MSALLALGTAAAFPLPNTAQSIISDNAMGNVRGALQSNMAAGNNNLQANVANIIMSPNGQGVATTSGVEQQASGTPSANFVQQQAKILGNAFHGATGLMSINQAAGAGNAEANHIEIVMGAAQPVSNQTLAQSLSSVHRDTSSSSSTQGGNSSQVAVAATAFHNAGGIAQVNQTSGSGNASANSFALGVAPGVMQ
ncbi:hypothetical protein AB4090_09535 [Acidithiobacillus sp. IBUN Pt1247-S3]|uniref:hypothetical protein n=1 Tax=Acidithiobacillus sp. IBUN Pt1247-S3 TaxID=3166642 RepID=UPI0034E5DFA4